MFPQKVAEGGRGERGKQTLSTMVIVRMGKLGLASDICSPTTATRTATHLNHFYYRLRLTRFAPFHSRLPVRLNNPFDVRQTLVVFRTGVDEKALVGPGLVVTLGIEIFDAEVDDITIPMTGIEHDDLC